MKPSRLLALLLTAGVAAPALAVPTDTAMLESLMARLDKLEKRNNELEKEVRTLKNENESVAKGLESERISQYEPELTARLKGVEKGALDMQKAAKLAEKLDGITVGATLSTVAQHAAGLPKGTQDGGKQLNYRADLTVGLPLESIGDIDHRLFAHVRVGQGQGLNTAFSHLGHFASAPNALAFRASGSNPDDSVAILGQAWYQASIPLPFGGFRPHSRETLELTFGKMDIFGFFDQNHGAGDEATQFLNSVFVHNPLLDAGAEVAVDANGFQPGFVASYVNKTNKAEPWRLSFGIFGAGERGANYQRSLSKPLMMAQAEKQIRLFGGLTGNYRAYLWSRAEANELEGVSTARHTGFGVSVDQRVGDGITLSSRYGHLIRGELGFRQALSLAATFNGSYWGRGGDTIGIAGSWLKSSGDYRASGGSGDLNGDGIPDFTFAPSGAEKVVEAYYRYRISRQFDLTPDFQWIGRPGANPDAKTVKVIGLRANIAY